MSTEPDPCLTSIEEGTRAHEVVEALFRDRRFTVLIVDEMWQPRAYQLEMMRQIERRIEPAQISEHDPRPKKGKFEPPHVFNSRLRAWIRRNP